MRTELRRERDQWENEISKLKIELGDLDRLNRTVMDKEEEIELFR